MSSGTLRPEDLTSALSSALAQILSSFKPPFKLSSQALELLLVAESGAHEELSSSEREQLSELCSDLFDLLDAVAPVGFSFSSHEGDGALFGFWLSSEICSELEQLNLGADSEPAALAELLQTLESLGVDICDLHSSYYAEAYGSTEAEAGRDFSQAIAEETGLLLSPPHTMGWPIGCIDWERAWEELRQDGYVLTPSLNSSATYDVWLPQ